MANHERLIHINSSYQTQTGSSNTDFNVNFNNSIHLQNSIYVRLKNISVPNMFFNVYGRATTLLVREGAIVHMIDVASGTYTADSLALALTTSAVPLTLDMTVTYSDNRFNFVFAAPGAALLSVSESKNFLSAHRTLNELVGVGFFNDSFSPVLAYTSQNPPALFGPTKIFIVSDQLAMGYSVHSNGSLHSKLGSISMASVPYGSIAFFSVSERANNQIYFSDARQANHIDITLIDEYDQNVELPENSHVDLEFILGSD